MSFVQEKIENLKENWIGFSLFFFLLLGALLYAREDGRKSSDAEWFEAIDRAEEE